jgi:flagellar assembly protein FliH
MSTDTAFLAVNFPRLRDSGSPGLEERAAARGHAAGYNDGLRLARAEVDAHIAKLDAEHAALMRETRIKAERTASLITTAAVALQERTVPVLADAHAALAAAAVELAEAIIGHQLADHERSALAAIDRALSTVDKRLVQEVRLHPGDLALLEDSAVLGSSLDDAAPGVTFIADASLQRGDAITEFADGYLDARISTALGRAKAALLRENP